MGTQGFPRLVSKRTNLRVTGSGPWPRQPTARISGKLVLEGLALGCAINGKVGSVHVNHVGYPAGVGQPQQDISLGMNAKAQKMHRLADHLPRGQKLQAWRVGTTKNPVLLGKV